MTYLQPQQKCIISTVLKLYKKNTICLKKSGYAYEGETNLLSEEWDIDEESGSTLLEDVMDRVSNVAEELGVPLDSDSLRSCISSGTVQFQHNDSLYMRESRCSWRQWYPVISVFICGHLHAYYNRLSGLLGLPSCLSTQ